ncbi:matrixin family metalloprotease [Nocardioides sp. CER19]|uniref:matrixin family metalloprotease n=1 Tax=Nocardioides sp. CER19 TaxID=3038538 RepID=UPI00244CD156|nr:matrixin family metalloprotease [Nocardioides sp. CER19]MDH2413777.1 matrixin family metalloprotease [Nocardioides sp. CER19]
MLVVLLLLALVPAGATVATASGTAAARGAVSVRPSTSGGDAEAARPRRCAKGKVRRHGRCVSRKKATRCPHGKVRKAGRCVRKKRAAAPAKPRPAHYAVNTDDGRTPVRWAACTPIPYYLNMAGAPAGWAATVAAVMGKVSAYTGYAFAFRGTTTYGVDDGENSIVIQWLSAAQDPNLAGSTVGIAYRSWGSAGTEPSYYTSVGIAMDKSLLGYDPKRRAGMIREVLLHEMGHAMGLDHVDDRTQVMNPSSAGDLPDYQNGDRLGLSKVGRSAAPCRPLDPPTFGRVSARRLSSAVVG